MDYKIQVKKMKYHVYDPVGKNPVGYLKLCLYSAVFLGIMYHYIREDDIIGLTKILFGGN